MVMHLQGRRSRFFDNVNKSLYRVQFMMAVSDVSLLHKRLYINMQFKHKRDIFYATLCGSHVTLPMTDAPANGCVNEKLV